MPHGHPLSAGGIRSRGTTSRRSRFSRELLLLERKDSFMLVRLIRECTGPNPEYAAKDHQAAQARGEEYTIPHTITLPVGTEIEHPLACLHCASGYRNEPAKAEPLDAAAKAATERLMKARSAGIEQLKAHLKFPPKDPVARRDLRETAKAYGLDAAGNPVEPDAAPEDTPPAS